MDGGKNKLLGVIFRISQKIEKYIKTNSCIEGGMT